MKIFNISVLYIKIFIVGVSCLKGQVGVNIDSIAILSVVESGFICSSNSSPSNYINCCIGLVNGLDIQLEHEINGVFEGRRQNLSTVYGLKVYKISFEEYEWVILNYKDRRSNGWYRLMGYDFNDFLHFYNKVMMPYLGSKKKVMKELINWQAQSKLLEGIDFNCLISSSFRRFRHVDCDISNSSLFNSRIVVINQSEDLKREYLKSQALLPTSSLISARLFFGSYPDFSIQ